MNTFQRYAPKEVCDYLEFCAKIADKKRKAK